MISNGNATIHVADLSAAIRFYTDTLGFTLTNRLGDRWATITAGPSYWTTEAVRAGLTLGLRPVSAACPTPGTRGGVGFGVETYRPVEEVEAEFRRRGVHVTSEIISFDAGHCFMFEDADGVAPYVHAFPPEMLDEADRAKRAARAADEPLLSGGHAIVYVSDMDAGIRFYTETLGLPLTNRFENHFATVEVGRSLVLGIHPQTPNTPIPGTKGSVTLSLVVDEPIDTVLARLVKRGVRVPAPPKPRGEGVTGRAEPRAEARERSMDIEDPDGNVITLWDAQVFAAVADLAAAASTHTAMLT